MDQVQLITEVADAASNLTAMIWLSAILSAFDLTPEQYDVLQLRVELLTKEHIPDTTPGTPGGRLHIALTALSNAITARETR